MLKSEIVGSVKMKCYLSGMPELRLGLNDKILFENTGSECSYVLIFLKCRNLDEYDFSDY